MKKKNKKIIPLDKFIDFNLYNSKSGFYMKHNPFGSKGDFITSPNISVMFSEMIAIWLISFWENSGSPKKFNLIELGSGNGEMIYQIINTLKKFPEVKKACKFFIFEKSPYLRKIQKIKLKNFKINWINNLNKISGGLNVFIANEFFDALPVKQFIKKDNKWFENYVDFSKKNKVKIIKLISNIKKLENKIGFKVSQNQNLIEFSPLTFNYLKKISKHIIKTNGALLIIDYGDFEEKMIDTIQGIKRHKHANILTSFGKTDITYRINFKLVEKIIQLFKLKLQGFTSQRDFLTRLGIQERAEILSKNLPFSKKTNLYLRLKRLIDKSQMGNLFKVMLITDKRSNFKTGFSDD